MANFVNRSDLEKQITLRRVVELFDDDCDGVVEKADAEGLAEVMAEANDITIGALYGKGFTAQELNGLSRDRSIRRCAVQIAAQIAGSRRAEFMNPQTGEGPFDTMGKRGREYLAKLSAGEYRSRLEEQHGSNYSIGGANTATDPPFIFSRDPSNRSDPYGPGGF